MTVDERLDRVEMLVMEVRGRLEALLGEESESDLLETIPLSAQILTYP